MTTTTELSTQIAPEVAAWTAINQAAALNRQAAQHPAANQAADRALAAAVTATRQLTR